MKRLLLFVLFLAIKPVYGQKIFNIDNFSQDFFAEVYIADTTLTFSNGWIGVFDKKTQKELIKVNSDELSLDLHDGKMLANIISLPYGEQGSIIYDDFNFDGQKDFAIMDGQNSCYHGPSYLIYLATPDGFKLNPDFTRLAQEYCGMFDVDVKKKQLATMTKSGCCWHQFSEFIVENNKPKPINIIEDDETNFPYAIYTEQVWDGKKMVKSTIKTINLKEDGVKPILTFNIDKNKKQIVLFNINDRILNYAVINKNNTVEFSYPTEEEHQPPDFIFDTKNNVLIFKNKDAAYKIAEKGNAVKVEIILAGKVYNWIGNIHTKTGTVATLLTAKLENVVIN